MEMFRARNDLDMNGPLPVMTLESVDAGEFVQADDPFGDEAAFPGTWQMLADGESGRD